MSLRRVAVTGMGIVSPLGNSCALFFDSLVNVRSGVRRIDTDYEFPLVSPVAATVNDFQAAQLLPAHKLPVLDRVSQFALVAAQQAIDDAKIDLAKADLDRIGTAVGTGIGGAHTLDNAYLDLYGHRAKRLRPMTLVSTMHSAPAANISIEFGLRGPSQTHSTACASSSIAIGEAARLIRHGYADVMIAGGAEALLTLGVIRAWEAMHTLAKVDQDCPETSCRPFSRDRSGLVLGEGAGFVVLEDMEQAQRRNVTIHAELIGYGSSSDANHLTQPAAEGQSKAMRLALADAAITPEDIGYINAHGTATLDGDIAETTAIKSVFGAHAQRVPVSATKALHGHLLGAAGGVEFLASLLALQHGVIPPTAHLHAADPACDLDYVPLQARPAPTLQTVMSNSFAFGGSNAVLIARKFFQ